MWFRNNTKLKDAHDKHLNTKPFISGDGEEENYDEDMLIKQIKELKDEIKILKAERKIQDERMWEIINKLIDKPAPERPKTASEIYAERKATTGGGFAAVDAKAKQK